MKKLTKPSQQQPKPSIEEKKNYNDNYNNNTNNNNTKHRKYKGLSSEK